MQDYAKRLARRRTFCEGRRIQTLRAFRRTQTYGLRMGLPRVSSEFMLDFWRSPPAYLKQIVTKFAVNFRSIFVRFSDDFRLFSVIFCVRRGLGKHFEQDLRKVALRRPTPTIKIPILGSFWEPAGSPKSTKIDPGVDKARPGRVPEAIFVDFSRRRRSESLSGPILGGSDP